MSELGEGLVAGTIGRIEFLKDLAREEAVVVF